MRDVYINGLGCFLPGEPVGNHDIQDRIGRIGGLPCKYKFLRQNRIRTRHYALDRAGKPCNSEMVANAIADAIRKSESQGYFLSRDLHHHR